jgi:hypothetical protein
VLATNRRLGVRRRIALPVVFKVVFRLFRMEPPRNLPHCPCDTISSMPIDDVLPLLIAERDKLNRAIEALEGTGKRLGRPSKKPVASETNAAPKKRHVSAAARRRMAHAQKRRWAAIKAAKK